MSFPVGAVHEGGFFMWPILILAFVGWVPPLVGVVLVGLRRWVPAAVWWGVPGAMLLFGAFGRIRGDAMVGDAVVHAMPDTRSMLLHAGMSEAAIPEAAAWIAGIPFLLFSALVLALALALGAGPRARWRLAPAALALLLCWCGALAAGALAFTLGYGAAASEPVPLELMVVLVLGGVALGLAAMRGSEEPKDAERLANGTVAVAALLLGAVLACWMTGDLLGFIQIHEVIPRAAPEMRLELATAGFFLRQDMLWLGLVGLCSVALAGLAASAPSFGALLRPRALASALVWLLVVVGVAAPVAWGHLSAAQLDRRTVETMATEILEQVWELPVPLPTGSESTAEAGLSWWQISAVIQGQGWIQGPGSPNEGAPVPRPAASAPGDGPVLVVAPADTPAQQVVSNAWAAEDTGPLTLAVFVDSGTRDPDLPWVGALRAGSVELTWLPAGTWTAPVRARASGVEDLPDGLLGALSEPPVEWNAGDPAWQRTFFVEGRGTGFALHTLTGSAADIATLPAALAGLPVPLDEQTWERAVFVPGPGWTLQDLVGHCLAARATLGREGRDGPETVECAVAAAVPTAALEAAQSAQYRRVLLDDPDRLFGLGGLGMRGEGFGLGVGQGRLGGGAGEGTAGVVGSEAIVLGALDKSLVDSVVRRNLNQIRYCYQQELTASPSLMGKIVVKFVVAKDGSVTSVTTKSSTMANPTLEGCINARFLRMRFPEPKGGGIVIVSYPFVFSPG